MNPTPLNRRQALGVLADGVSGVRVKPQFETFAAGTLGHPVDVKQRSRVSATPARVTIAPALSEPEPVPVDANHEEAEQA